MRGRRGVWRIGRWGNNDLNLPINWKKDYKEQKAKDNNSYQNIGLLTFNLQTLFYNSTKAFRYQTFL
jgi:hypothetical protein